MQLVRPEHHHLDSYVAALRRGWSADTTRPAAAQDELRRIDADPIAFISSMEDREGTGPMIKLPDGSQVNRLPGFRRWMWDGEFSGSISLRWRLGTTDLPPQCLGHIGYAVVPWKQRRGFATQALRDLLPEAWAVDLPFVELITDPENLASRRVVESNGGTLIEEFTEPPEFGSKRALRFRIVRPR